MSQKHFVPSYFDPRNLKNTEICPNFFCPNCILSQQEIVPLPPDSKLSSPKTKKPVPIYFVSIETFLKKFCLIGKFFQKISSSKSGTLSQIFLSQWKPDSKFFVSMEIFPKFFSFMEVCPKFFCLNGNISLYIFVSMKIFPNFFLF